MAKLFPAFVISVPIAGNGACRSCDWANIEFAILALCGDIGNVDGTGSNLE